eukprot:9081858-Pyramimonas_sp.AAC.1
MSSTAMLQMNIMKPSARVLQERSHSVTARAGPRKFRDSSCLVSRPERLEEGTLFVTFARKEECSLFTP